MNCINKLILIYRNFQFSDSQLKASVITWKVQLVHPKDVKTTELPI